jgi:hypothetical protein|tara:strand:+ start:1079 stop:1723 length:645 start_codon:yes stop_codon:yes gene_type:complete
MKLISEEVSNAEYLVEETNGKKDYKIRGIFLQSNMKNRNGRVYPKDILENEVTRYNKEFINKKRAFGELGHPDGPTVNLERVSHMITKLHPDGNNFIGEAKIMNTPYGKIVKGLIDEGAQLGVSSRGMGSLIQRNGANYVKDDFYLATAADIVADPSAPDAFVEGIMENKEWVWDNGVLKEKDIEAWKSQVQSAKQRALEESKLKVFESFLKKL